MDVFTGFSREGERKCPEMIAGILSGNNAGELMSMVLRAHCGNTQLIREATVEFISTLRRLLDQWVDSGIREGDKDVSEPWTRSIDWTSPQYLRPLKSVLMEFGAAYPPRLLLLGDGRYAVSMQEAYTSPGEPISAARAHAIQWFVSLLNSPTREKLSRCDGCSTYFVRARMPKKDVPTFHGTFCPGCKNKGSALRTAKSRTNRAGERVRWAADALLKWRPQQRFGKREMWVKDAVNARLPSDQAPITVNWVSHHWTDIEVEAERRKHAKG